MNVDLDNNFIGKLNRLMGYVSYRGFTLRYQQSNLRGMATWTGDPVSGMPTQSSFDNLFISIDLLHYFELSHSTGQEFYYGIGYASYQLPVQLDCTIYYKDFNYVSDGTDVYQPDMTFHLYSLMFGFDTLHDAMRPDTRGPMSLQGLSMWGATQDRIGGGVTTISDQAKSWVETANPGRTLGSPTVIDVLVDYDLTIGIQWVKPIGICSIGSRFGLQSRRAVYPNIPVKRGSRRYFACRGCSIFLPSPLWPHI